MLRLVPVLTSRRAVTVPILVCIAFALFGTHKRQSGCTKRGFPEIDTQNMQGILDGFEKGRRIYVILNGLVLT